MICNIEPDFEMARRLLNEGDLALSRVERNGMRIDVSHLNETVLDVARRVKCLEKEIKETETYDIWRKRFGKKTNLGSGEQLGVVLFGELGHECTEYTEGGSSVEGKPPKRRPKTDAAALRRIDSPFTRDYLEVERLKKLQNTFLAGILRELSGEFLHPIFNLNLVKTFRSSSSMPNSQNFPKRDPVLAEIIRSCFIPRDGHVLVELDISGAEVRVAACYNQDPTLIEYILDPTKDMHRDMAAQIYKCDNEQVSKQMRHCGKNSFVFPQFYGSFFIECARNLWNAIDQDSLEIDGVGLKRHLRREGIKKLGSLDLSKAAKGGTFVHHVRQVEKDFWGRRFKVYTDWKQAWWDAYQKSGWFGTLTGFRIQGAYSRNDVINYPIQGSAFHCLLWALTRLVLDYIPRYNMGTKIIGQIHDSIIADVPIDELSDFLEIAYDVMVVQLRKAFEWIIVPFEIEAMVSEKNWFEQVEVEI